MPFKKGVIPPGAKVFKKGQSGNPKGARRKLLSHVNDELKRDGYETVKPEQIIESLTLLFNLDIKRVQEVISNEKYPMFLRIVAKEMMSQTRGAEMIERMLDRAFGKATQKIDQYENQQTNLTINIS